MTHATLAPGDRFGAYEVVELVGAGGMGEVYRARDTRLSRDVALKILPDHRRLDRQRRARFEREAQLLSSLNHPNIATLHGIEQSGGATALVMELVEGETLADMISPRRDRSAIGSSDRRGTPLSVRRALEIARQISDALDSAHGRGIIHRDLKPANIKVRPDGTVKVLDFGLAKAAADDAPGDTTAATLTASGTVGVVVGTAAYMSPEQARGLEVDRRTDVWAFGCVLYEMLTGGRAFDGDTTSDALANVLNQDPDFTALPTQVPSSIRSLLRHCLAKEARERLRDIGDARLEITDALDPGASGSAWGPVAASQGKRRVVVPWLAAIASSTGLALLVLNPATPERHPISRHVIPLAERDAKVDAGGEVSVVAIARDGTYVAYVANGGLYVRNVRDDWDAVRIVESVGLNGGLPVFAPDVERLAYWDGQAAALKTISVRGGRSETLLANLDSSITDLHWDERGTLLFVTARGISEVPAIGGEPRLIVPAKEGERLGSSQPLPGGEAILFVSNALTSDWNAGRIEVFERATGRRHVIHRGGRDARYAAGHLLYVRGDTLFARPFDPGRPERLGDPVRLEQGLSRAPTGLSDTAQYSVSDAGALVYLAGATSGFGGREMASLVWVDRQGKEEAIPVTSDLYMSADLSPDQTRVVLAAGTRERGSIWLYRLGDGGLVQLTSPGYSPTWCGNDRILFLTEIGGHVVGSIPAEGGTVEPVATADRFIPLPWSAPADCRTLFAVGFPGLGDTFIAALSLADRQFSTVRTGGVANEPQLSRDERWLVYVEGIRRIVVRPYPDVEGPVYPVAEGSHPVWSRDGTEIFHFRGGCIYAASVTSTPSFVVRRRDDQLFCGNYIFGGGRRDGDGGRGWDVSADGKRFLMVKPVGPEPRVRPQLNVVDNVFELVRQRQQQ